MTDRYKRALFLLLLIAGVILAAGLGLRDPWPADEPRFALIARDMAESGRWLFPNVGGVLYPDKPPLHFWLVAVLYTITGSLRISFLLPALLQGLAIIALVADLGRRLWGETAGLWSGAILLAMLQFPLQMKSGQLDGPLCFWTTLSLYGLSRHLLQGPDWRWYAIGGLAAGLGVITKGVGVLPYLVFIPWFLARRRNWALPMLPPRDWRWALAPLLTLAAVSAWLLPILLVAAKSGDPATLLLPWLLPAWWGHLRAKQNTPLLFLGGWVLLVLVFFSLSSGKRSVYIFPAAPAFALIVGAYATDLLGRKSVLRTAFGFSLLLGGLLAAAGLYGLIRPETLLGQIPDPEVIRQSTVALAAIGLLAVILNLAIGRRRALGGLGLSLVTLWLGLSLVIAPGIDRIRSGQTLMHSLETTPGVRQEIGLVGWPEQFLLQAERPVYHFGFRRDLDQDLNDAIAWLLQDADRQVLVSEEQVRECLGEGPRVDLGFAHRRQWLLIDASSLADKCDRKAPDRPHMLYFYGQAAGLF
jgi:4-amino-4-deoxy-L-arabinose transferase-like glycosyltransferase